MEIVSGVFATSTLAACWAGISIDIEIITGFLLLVVITFCDVPGSKVINTQQQHFKCSSFEE